MFDKLIGNDSNKEIFQRLIETKRIPHSLLFVGKDGIGKKQFALQIAKSLVCQNPQNSLACDNCKNCVRASKFELPKADNRDAHKEVIFSEHPDVGTVINYKNTIFVDAIRNLEKEAHFLPYESKARIFIIDNAEKLSSTKDNAANALLKTLEEPSDTTYIFLITSQPAALLPTILSRCQTIRFAPIAENDIKDHLINSENLPTEDAKLIAKISRGSIGEALQINLEQYQQQRNQMLKVLESLSQQRTYSNLFRVSETLSDIKNKDSYEKSLEILQTLIHDIWTLQNNSNAEIVNFDITSKLNSYSENTDGKTLTRWLGEVEELRSNLKSNLNRKIATDSLFMKMAN